MSDNSQANTPKLFVYVGDPETYLRKGDLLLAVSEPYEFWQWTSSGDHIPSPELFKPEARDSDKVKITNVIDLRKTDGSPVYRIPINDLIAISSTDPANQDKLVEVLNQPKRRHI